MAISFVKIVPFTFTLLGDGATTAITLPITITDIVSLGPLSVNSDEGVQVTVDKAQSKGTLSIVFSKPFTGIVTVSGSYVLQEVTDVIKPAPAQVFAPLRKS